jgi:hypothetical protein
MFTIFNAILNAIRIAVVEIDEWRLEKDTEEVGFEPTVPCRTSVFKTDAIGHSATLPQVAILYLKVLIGQGEFIET